MQQDPEPQQQSCALVPCTLVNGACAEEQNIMNHLSNSNNANIEMRLNVHMAKVLLFLTISYVLI